MKNTFINIILFLLFLIVFMSCNNSQQDFSQTKQKITTHKISTNEGAVNNSVLDSTLLAPDFSYPSMNGDKFTLSEHRGKVIVLNIWATWCGPCIKEIPDFIDLKNEFRDKNIEFVGLSIDGKGWDVVRPFVEKHNMNYRVLLDKEGSILEKYPIQGLPDTYIINTQGEIAYAIISMTTKELLGPLITHLIEN